MASQNYPNKTDIIAAALFGLMCASEDVQKPTGADVAPVTAAGAKAKAKPQALWREAAEEDRKACLDTAGFLLSFTHGADLRTFDHRRLEKALDERGKGTKFGFTTSPEVVTTVFLNLSNLLG